MSATATASVVLGVLSATSIVWGPAFRAAMPIEPDVTYVKAALFALAFALCGLTFALGQVMRRQKRRHALCGLALNSIGLAFPAMAFAEMGWI